jgi:hypothetical protein
LAGWHTHLLYFDAFLREDPLPMTGFWSMYDQLSHTN